LPSPRVTVAGNVVTVDPATTLDCNTDYYLIVPSTAVNGVGFTGITTTTAWNFVTSLPSAILSFTASTGLPLFITDNLPVGVNNTQTVTNTSIINNNLTIGVAVNHTWVGDVIVRLTHVASGTTVVLIDRMGVPVSTVGCSSDNFNVILSDAAALPIETQCAANLTGTFIPNNPLAAFNGLSLNSAWTLNVNDNAGGDTGSIISWRLIVATTELPFTATFTPTNGATNVAANSNLVLDFPYPVSAGVGNIEIVNATTSAVLETIPVGDARVTFSGGQVTINPTTNFPNGAVVAVRFVTGAFKSCNNLNITGITNTTDWRFTVVDPCATLTINAGTDQVGVASGSNVNLAGIAATGGTGPYTYAWTPAAGLSNAAILNPVASNVVASATYTLTVTDTGTGCTKADGVFISVTPPSGGGGGGPAPTVTAPLLRLTSINSTSIRLNWTGGNGTAYTIYRRGGASANFTVVRNVTAAVSTLLDSMLLPNTPYSYYVQATNGGSIANSNTASDYTYPSAPIVASFQNACTGTGAQLTVKGSTGVYNVYSSLTGGTAVVSGDSTRAITTPAFTQPTTFYISAIGTRYESTPRVAVNVITRALPTAVLLGAIAQESCTDTLTIMAQAVAGATYTWYSSDAPLATTTVPMYRVNRSGVYSVLVNREGCVARSNPITVRLNVIAPAQISGNTSRPFCEVGTLQALQTQGATYEWQRNGTVVGTTSSLTVTQSGTYTVRVTSPLGCVLTSAPVTVTVINVPQLDLETSASDFCEGTDGVELTVNAVSGATYEWLRNGRRIRTTSTPSLQVNVGAEYRVRVLLDGTCSRVSDPVIVTRNAAPVTNVRVYGDSIKVVYNGNVAVTSISWTKDGAPFSATTQAFLPTESGLYSATVTYATGCEVTSSGVTYIFRPKTPVVVGEEEVEALGFMLFPNPTASKVNLTFGDAFKGDVTLTLTDAIGRVIQVVKVKATENATIDLSTVANGTYMLTIASKDKVVTRKIIRE